MRKYVPAEEHNVAAEYFFTSDVQLGDKKERISSRSITHGG